MRNRRLLRNYRLYLAALGLLSLFVYLAGCDSADNPLAPTGSILFVTASPNSISLTGSSVVTVSGFKPDNNPLNPGTLVSLSTNLGTLSATTVTIDSDGRATTVLTPDGRTGTATVTASLTGGGTGGGGGDGGGGGGGTASSTVDVLIGAPMESRPSVVISANPTDIPTGGTSRVSLLARASDNSPVGADTRIRLTADLGGLTCASRYFCSDTVGNDCRAVCTDANGEAEVTFRAGDRSGDGMVRAIVGTSEEATVTITINAALDSLSLSADQQNITRSDAGEEIVLTAVLQDSQGNPVRALVRFSSEAGSFDNDAVTSNTNGIAMATLIVEAIDVQNIPENGTFTISATATSEGTTRTDSVEITVLGAP